MALSLAGTLAAQMDYQPPPDLEPMHRIYDELLDTDVRDGTVFYHALKLDPKLAVAYTNRGLILLLQGKDAEAQSDFDQCLLLKPDLKADLERRIELAKERRCKKS